ncbi:MAG: L-fuculose-phosphate aldolase [Desulfarculaceae bacterium]|nr:L-fuculose-phosphate aldolase [Desulfarculaceae bacterium]MCF8071727.1 L-fuculose-phosphate aldolase [Desulfarculaceae bacterium]MCF8102426.1 L-fuculose-phosphate aldolase [Desulfarculaceae bacterium]MCF8116768.1 L-fuculose-phosphate aldolase [Desulfarculaceae bacterium]
MLRERKLVTEFGRKMVAGGLTTGSGGNISLLNQARTLAAITPSGVDYLEMTPGQVVLVDLEGKQADGPGRPSSELGFHLSLYRERPEAMAVVHTHSPYATTLACLGWELPPAHYLVGFAGPKVPLAPYHTYGTPELAAAVVKTMRGYNAALLANHGLVAVGPSLTRAFAVAEEVEFAARVYYQAKAVGDPKILSRQQMAKVLAKFETYGQQ